MANKVGIPGRVYLHRELFDQSTPTKDLRLWIQATSSLFASIWVDPHINATRISLGGIKLYLFPGVLDGSKSSNHVGESKFFLDLFKGVGELQESVLLTQMEHLAMKIEVQRLVEEIKWEETSSNG